MARQDRNPYEVLGLEPSATRVEIRAAYLRLAKKHHPDKNPGDKASEWIFKEVGRAYETLRGTSDNRSSRGDASRRERQEHERAEPEGRQRDKGSREQTRREQQAREEAAHRRREQEERERRQARREQQAREEAESKRREQFVEESERRWKEVGRIRRERDERERRHPWIVVSQMVVISLFVLTVLKASDVEAPIGLGIWWFAMVIYFGFRSWKEEHENEQHVSWPPNACRVTYCEDCNRISVRRFANDRSQCLHCKGGPIITRVCASRRAAEDFMAEYRRRWPVREDSDGR